MAKNEPDKRTHQGLLPCPFCGSLNVYLHHQETTKRVIEVFQGETAEIEVLGGWGVGCHDCAARGAVSNDSQRPEPGVYSIEADKQHAKASWNMRGGRRRD